MKGVSLELHGKNCVKWKWGKLMKFFDYFK